MKTRVLRVGLTVIWAAVFIALSVMLATGYFGGAFSVVNAGVSVGSELLREQQSPSAGVERLEIQTGSPSVRLLATDGGTFAVRHYGPNTTDEKHLVQVSADGDTLRVTVIQKTNVMRFGIFSEEYLEIEIPRDWTGKVNAATSSGSLRVKDAFSWKDTQLHTSSGSLRVERELAVDGPFRARTSSGSLNLDALTAASADLQTSSGTLRVNRPIAVQGAFRAQTSSGSLYLDELSAESGELKTTSGTLTTEGRVVLTGPLTASTSSGSLRLRGDVTAQSVRASTSSGRLSADRLETQSYDLSSTSGGISGGVISGGGRMKSSSGSVQIDRLMPTGDVDITATSGGVKVAVPRDYAFAFEGHCTSGSIRSDYDLYFRDRHNRSAYYNHGENGVSLRIETSSGGIRLGA